MEVSTAELQKVVQRMHACNATLRDVHKIKETFGDQIVWEGLVHVFWIEGNPESDTCYAWSSAVEGSHKRRYYAVLKIPPIDSPQAAVRAAIVADHKAGRAP